MEKEGLVYNDTPTPIGDLVNRDTDGDGVLDWEEGLWGTDPTKKETTPGTPDNVAIEQLKAAQGPTTTVAAGTDDSENLNQTDQFSRDLFATVAATNQNGAMDQTTVDQITSSLSTQLQNSVQRKTYAVTDLKITQDNSAKAVKAYSDALESIHNKYPINGNVIAILQKFLGDGNTVDTSVLGELDTDITPIQSTIHEIEKVTVPQSLVPLHLDFLNALQKLTENMSDIKLYDSDPIVALTAINQYQNTIDSLQSAFIALNQAIDAKLSN